MLPNIPLYVYLIFVLTTLLCLIFFYLTLKNSFSKQVQNKAGMVFIGLVVWLILQAILSISNIYNSSPNSLPPTILVWGIFPNILGIIALFTTKYGKIFVDSLPLKYLTILNIIRIPVELVLFWLFLVKTIPQLMTFEGLNFDIFAGITAPIVFYFGFIKKVFSGKVILFWNVICLLLLINIVLIALFSAPSPLQKLAFEQPNVAILNFPFSWLPTFIVPIVLFGHLVSIRQLLIVEK